MEQQEILLRHAADLQRQAAAGYTVTHTAFLTPAEQYVLRQEAARCRWENLRWHGGGEGCERQAAFFLPEYLPPDMLDAGEYISAFECVTKFASPGHRDYLGALMGLGIRRECIGDIRIDGDTAYFFCLPSVSRHILLSLDKIGRYGARLRAVPLSAVPAPERRVREISFSVKSPRLDAVVSGMFGVSRTAAAELIRLGQVTLNYSECLKPDAPVSEGDVISARGHGKGTVASLGGVTRKGRLFLTAEIYC